MRIGILTQAQRAKTETENAAANEAARLDEYNQVMNNWISGGTTGGGSIGTTDGSWNDEKGVNSPVIKENMELVKWDGNKFVPDDTNTSYNYDETNKQWANAKVTIEGEESYFVWIPRYEYKINYITPGTPENGGTIDVKFIPTTKTEADEGYIIHPAFTNNVENGGWDSELPGIWVGKYESSLVNKVDSSNVTTSSSTIGNILLSENTDKAIAVQPGMTSWRYCAIGNMYTNAKEYSTSLNSHMLKNSEWGAIAYLTESKYGRNGIEVEQNTSYNTANGDIKANMNQSSTGNITGLYDISGGGSESVAAYYTGGESTDLNSAASLVNESDKKYVTEYTGSNLSVDYKIGDATYETKKWHNDTASFVNVYSPFFSRGGRKTNGRY